MQGLHSASLEIQQASRQGLLQCNALLHPRQRTILGGLKQSGDGASLTVALEQIAKIAQNNHLVASTQPLAGIAFRSRVLSILLFVKNFN